MVKLKKDLVDLAIVNGLNFNNKIIINELVDLLESNSITKFEDGTKISTMRRNSPKKSSAKKVPSKKTAPKKTAPKKTAPKKTAPKKTAPKKTAPKKTVANKTAPKKTVANKTAPKKTAPKKTVAKKRSPKKIAPKKTVEKKRSPKKTVPKKTVPKKTVPKKTVPKKTVPKKTVPKKTVPKRNAAKKTVPKRNAPKRNAAKKTAPTKSPSIKSPSIKSPSIKSPSIKSPSIKSPSIKSPSIKSPTIKSKGINIPNNLEKPMFTFNPYGKIIENFEKSFKFIERLGKGTFGTVAAYENYDSKIVAIKSIRIDCIARIDLIKNEIEMFKKISKLSDSFPKYYDSFVLVKEQEKSVDFLIVQEYISGTDLYAFIRGHENFTEQVLIDFAKWLFSSVRILHKNGIVHRDIKVNNIMVEKDTGRYILLDFGGSCMITARDFTRCEGINGTFFSPEMLTQYTPYYTKKDQDILYSSDIWCCGIVMYVMAEKMMPFLHKDNKTKGKTEALPKKSLIKIGEKDLPFDDLILPKNEWFVKMPDDMFYDKLIKMKTSSKIIKNIIKSALMVNYENRPTARDILEYLDSM